MKKFIKQFQKTSNLAKLDLIIKFLIAFSGIALTIMHFVDPVTWHKLPSYLVTIILPFIPDLIAKINLHTSTKLRLAYSSFLIIAMVFGIDLDWYKNLIIFGYPSYDKIVHTLSGVFSAFLAKEILDNVYDGKDSIVKSSSTSRTSEIKVKKYSTAFAFLFIVSFVFFVAAAWECFEFSYDQLCGGHMQELNAPGVGDTMGDIISAGIGGLIFSFFFRKK
ncbi:hypothetical protein EUA79_01005 [TM7 phylum sp. oral taxon 351]|nr:hypothetical protein EUA79_01005 [TM7 phylum sp. oral taxon 351]